MARDGVYEHYFKEVPIKEEYPQKIKKHRVDSLEALDKALKECKEKSAYIAWDTETSSLNPEEGFMVGFSFAISTEEGWYCPVKHIDGGLGKKALEIFYSYIKQFKMNFLYNLKFDFRWMSYQGFDMSVVPYYEVMVGVFLSDTNMRGIGLKWAERHFLGWNPDTFTETLDGQENFYYLSIDEAYPYAVVDACGTFGVALATIKFYQEAGLAGKMDNQIVYPIMKFEEKKIPVDVDLLRSYKVDMEKQLLEMENKIYSLIGYPIKLNSSKQLGDALQSLGIHTETFTKGGQMKVDIQTLDHYKVKIEKDGGTPPEILGLLIEHSKLFKEYNSYVVSGLSEAERLGGYARFCYHQFRVPTCRLACGSDKKNGFYTHMNVQSFPKPHPLNYYVHEYQGEELKEGEVKILNWRFSPTDKSNYVVEGFNPHYNMRSIFRAPEGQLAVSCDFSGQELRCIANLSNEPTWVNAFLSGGDLHKSQAIAMWGEENYDKEKRKRAKVLNFGMCVCPGELILTDKGYKPVEELIGEERLVNSEGGLSQFLIKENSQGVCYKVEYKNGIIGRYLEGHRVRVWDGDRIVWKPVEDINDEQVLYKVGELRDREDKSHLCRGIVPYLIGLYLGDGNIDRGFYSCTIVVESPVRELLEEFFKSEGIEYKYYPHEGKGYGILYFKGSLVREIGELFGRTEDKHIWDGCFTEFSNEALLKIVSGLIDTDGSYSDGKLYFKNTNRELINQVALICQLNGIDTTVSEFQPGITENGERRYQDRKGNPLKTCYELRLDSSEGLSLMYKRKQGEVQGWRREIIVSETLSKEQQNREEPQSKGKDRWYNIRRGTKLTDKVLNESVIDPESSLGELKRFLDGGGRLTTIKKKTGYLDTSYQIGIVDGPPEYISSGIVSHNCYGMSGYSLAEKFNVSVEEGEDIVAKFWKAAPHIKLLQDRSVRKAKKEGTVYNAFHRPRRVKYWLNHSDPKKRAFGVRTVNNTIIQSVGAELLRIGIIKLWKRLYNNSELSPNGKPWSECCRFVNTVHDEINSFCDEDVIEEFVKIKESCMKVIIPNWKVPFITSCDIGTSWGMSFPFKWENGHLVPDAEFIESEEEPVIKESEEEDIEDFDEVPEEY